MNKLIRNHPVSWGVENTYIAIFEMVFRNYNILKLIQTLNIFQHNRQIACSGPKTLLKM
jgi:hypothetical protein